MSSKRSRFFSLKWKISLSLVGIALSLVGLYVIIAKRTFESDKISYVFDAQQTQVGFLARDINQKLDRSLFDARSILTGYDFETKSLNQLGRSLFDSYQGLLGIELIDEASSESLLKLEKTPGTMPAWNLTEPRPTPGKIELRALGGSRYLLLSSESGATGAAYRLRVFIEQKSLFSGANRSSRMILAFGDSIVSLSEGDPTDPASVKLTRLLSKEQADITSFREVSGRRYLVSTANLSYTGWRVISITSEEAALGALGVLYQRSIFFMAFSFFATVLLSLLLSLRLTRNLQVLTRSANDIGRGDFSQTAQVKSTDEIGILGAAFSTMSHEIQRLLSETKDKARMEEELKTARVVQESLFPAESRFSLGEISLAGHFMTSTECGGDWWHYFARGDDLYILIADATGHGTPAALITSAARSLFSMIERSPQITDLSEMARQWDFAVASCSNRKVFMTALLLKIATRTGEIEMVNACHEWPVLVTNEDGELKSDFMELKKNHTLGETFESGFMIQKAHMAPGDRLVVYTDGLTSIENPEGQTLGERRFLTGVRKIAQRSPDAQDLADEVLAFFEKHRKGHPLPDDVTLVTVVRAG